MLPSVEVVELKVYCSSDTRRAALLVWYTRLEQCKMNLLDMASMNCKVVSGSITSMRAGVGAQALLPQRVEDGAGVCIDNNGRNLSDRQLDHDRPVVQPLSGAMQCKY